MSATTQRRASLHVALWLGAVLSGCSLALIGVAALAPRLTPDMGIAPESVGIFSGLAWSAALLASVGCAPLVLRWGPWSVARLSVLACSAGVLCVALAHPALFWLGAVLVGIGQGLEAPPASQLLGQHVAANARPFYFSLKQTGVQFGAVAASLSLPLLAAVAGWQAALGCVAFVLLLLAWSLAQPARRFAVPAAMDECQCGSPPATSALVPLVSWVAILRGDRALLRLALAAATFGATQACMNTFLVTWMVTTRGASLTRAGLLAATAQAAGLVGRPLWGWMASRLGGSRVVMTWLGLLMSACSALLGALGAVLPHELLFVLAAAFGLSASGWNGLFLSEVAQRCSGSGIAAGTAAAMVPLILGLIIGPAALAGIGCWQGLPTGFMMLGCAALAGTMVLAWTRRARSPASA